MGTDGVSLAEREQPVTARPGHSPGQLAITRLVVTHFRNYARAALAPDARPVVLVGENGAGKTNLLEAVSLLAPGRGLRGDRLADISTRATGRTGVGDSTDAMEETPTPPPWGVAATVTTPHGPVDLGTGIARSAEGDKRIVKVNGAAASGSGALGHYVRALWLTPPMDRLFMDAATGRRRFLDRMVVGFDAGHAARISAYERAMRARTRLLAEGRADASWLAALEAQMAEHGIAIAVARSHVIGELTAAIANQAAANQGTSGPLGEAGDVGDAGTAFPRAAIALSSGLTASVEDKLRTAAVDAEDAFAAHLAAARPRDAAAGRALEGPHRADMLVRHAPKNMDARACSTGEQKALLIGLVLANARAHRARFGAPPLLLLDEITAHLDAPRRAALFDALISLGAQAWMTGTDAGLFDSLSGRAQMFDIAAGMITPRG